MSKVKDVIQRTRDLFAATHWANGTMFGTRANEGPGEFYKKVFCAVGGLRLSAQATARELADQEARNREIDLLAYAHLADHQPDVIDPGYEEYVIAVKAIACQAVMDRLFIEAYPAYQVQQGVGMAKFAGKPELVAELTSVQQLEDIIVQWNDMHHEDLEMDTTLDPVVHGKEGVLAVFDRAMESLEEETVVST